MLNKNYPGNESFTITLTDLTDISENIQRFQKTLQHAKSKVDYAIGEFICMLPSDMNLRTGKIKNRLELI